MRYISATIRSCTVAFCMIRGHKKKRAKPTSEAPRQNCNGKYTTNCACRRRHRQSINHARALFEIDGEPSASEHPPDILTIYKRSCQVVSPESIGKEVQYPRNFRKPFDLTTRFIVILCSRTSFFCLSCLPHFFPVHPHADESPEKILFDKPLLCLYLIGSSEYPPGFVNFAAQCLKTGLSVWNRTYYI